MKNYTARIIFFTALVFTMTSANITEKTIDQKQTAEIFKKVADWFKDTEKFSLHTEFSSYISHESANAHEVQTGYVKKKSRSFHCFMMGIHTIQDEKYQLMIDSSQKIISIKDAEQSIWESINPIIIEKGIAGFQNITLNEEKDISILKATPPKSSPINSYQMTYDKSFRIRNVIIKMTKEERKEDGRTTYKIYPRVNMRFYDYTNGSELKPSDFDLSAFVDINADDISVKQKYKDFKFLDLRFKQKSKN